jgi:hypothetical protein
VSFTDRLEIRIPRILRESCFGARLDGIFAPYRGPDVLPESWESDLANLLDEDVAAALADDEGSPQCQPCRGNLHGKPLYVETVELSERLGVSDETITVEVPRKLRAEVIRLYGRNVSPAAQTAHLELIISIPGHMAAPPLFRTFSRCARNAYKRRPTTCRSIWSPCVTLTHGPGRLVRAARYILRGAESQPLSDSSNHVFWFSSFAVRRQQRPSTEKVPDISSRWHQGTQS